ncbi:hypothetical protein RND71_012057 [Anisodus tanguticus]|uniref:Uncharacterized protein n=1 Tax=Anisodus tanguticus TaxID=243964 RepID=A0AAE1SDV5_9SOLA|nr:hypothetical protein RND71_012057 [Anisodus tanguticus]
MYTICRKLKLIEQATKSMHKEASSLDKRIIELHEKLQDVQGELQNDLFNSQLIMEKRTTLVELEKWTIIHEQSTKAASQASSQNEDLRVCHSPSNGILTPALLR